MRDAAPSAELSPKAEHTKGSREETTPALQTGPIEKLFRKVKAALFKPPAPAPEPNKKKRRDDTDGLFRRAYRLWRKAETRRAFQLTREILPPRIYAWWKNSGTAIDMQAEHRRILECSAMHYNPQQKNHGAGVHYATGNHLSPRL